MFVIFPEPKNEVLYLTSRWKKSNHSQPFSQVQRLYNIIVPFMKFRSKQTNEKKKQEKTFGHYFDISASLQATKQHGPTGLAKNHDFMISKRGKVWKGNRGLQGGEHTPQYSTRSYRCLLKTKTNNIIGWSLIIFLFWLWDAVYILQNLPYQLA